MDAEFRVARLERLADLLKKGIISEAEFAEEKRKLLATGVKDIATAPAVASSHSNSLQRDVEHQVVRDISEDQINRPIAVPAFRDHAYSDRPPPISESLLVEQLDRETLRPNFWKFALGLVGLLLLGDSLGFLPESFVLCGSLVCGMAYFYQKRGGIVSWLPRLHVRSTWAAGLFLIATPFVAGFLPLATNEEAGKPPAPVRLSEEDGAGLGLNEGDAGPDEIVGEPPTKIGGRTTYLAGCRMAAESQVGYGECLANMDSALRECDIFRNTNEEAYNSCLGQISSAYHF